MDWKHGQNMTYPPCMGGSRYLNKTSNQNKQKVQEGGENGGGQGEEMEGQEEDLDHGMMVGLDLVEAVEVMTM